MASWRPWPADHEVSPREREDMAERDRRDFDPEQEEQVWYEVRIIDDED